MRVGEKEVVKCAVWRQALNGNVPGWRSSVHECIEICDESPKILKLIYMKCSCLRGHSWSNEPTPRSYDGWESESSRAHGYLVSDPWFVLFWRFRWHSFSTWWKDDKEKSQSCQIVVGVLSFPTGPDKDIHQTLGMYLHLGKAVHMFNSCEASVVEEGGPCGSSSASTSRS